MNRRLLCLWSCLLLAPMARAAPPQWGGSIVLSSDYLLRGVSRSDEEPAFSTELHTQWSNGVFAGIWASTARPRTQAATTMEFSATLGYAHTLGENWLARTSFSHYETPWSSVPGFYAYDELTVDVIYLERLYLSASFSPNTSRYAPLWGPAWHRNAAAYEASYQHAFTPLIHGALGLGYFDLSDLFGDGYWYSSAGLALNRGHWRLDLSYVITSGAAKRLTYGGSADNRALASLSYSFSQR